MANRQKLVRGEAFSIAFFCVSLPLIQGRRYDLVDGDKLIFTIGRKDRKPIVRLTYPGSIERDVNNTFMVHLTAQDTVDFPCLLYDMCLSVDLQGHGKEIYTLVKQELEVVAK